MRLHARFLNLHLVAKGGLREITILNIATLFWHENWSRILKSVVEVAARIASNLEQRHVIYF